MKLKKLLPLLLLALALAWLLLPGGEAKETVQEVLPAVQNLAEDRPQSAPLPDNDTELVLLPESQPASEPEAPASEPEAPAIDENGVYDTAEDVALYVRTYGHLPSNFVTKKEAEAAGWDGGALDRVLPGKCIGGDYFGNYENQLPKAKGRRYTECDLNTLGAKRRGPERLIFSNDGLIYYTPDHYESFILLYGEP